MERREVDEKGLKLKTESRRRGNVMRQNAQDIIKQIAAMTRSA